MKLTCPCGFTGHTRNIRDHRANCPAWPPVKADGQVSTAKFISEPMTTEQLDALEHQAVTSIKCWFGCDAQTAVNLINDARQWLKLRGWRKRIDEAKKLEQTLRDEFANSKDLTERVATLTAELEALRRDKERLNHAILYPNKFLKLMETRAHGGFVEEELQQGRTALDEAMKEPE